MNYGYTLSWEEFKDIFPELVPVIIPIAILLVVLTVAAIISLLRKKLPINLITIWMIIIIFVSLIGPVIYFAIGSKMLDEKKRKMEDTRDERYRNK